MPVTSARWRPLVINLLTAMASCVALLATVHPLAAEEPLITGPLPEDLQWRFAERPAATGSSSAEPGGVLRLAMTTSRVTLRRAGEHSQHSLTPTLNALQFPLFYWYPYKTSIDQALPGLATAWALDHDRHRLTIHLRSDIFWSDGQPITTYDIASSIAFARHHQAWLEMPVRQAVIHNARQITLVNTGDWSDPQLHQIMSLRPMPSHYWEQYPQSSYRNDWRPEPTSGPYRISQVIPSERISFVRKQNWWGNNLPQFRNRFNVSQVQLHFIDDENHIYQTFINGEIDAVSLPGSMANTRTEAIEIQAINQYRFQRSGRYQWRCRVDNPASDTRLFIYTTAPSNAMPQNDRSDTVKALEVSPMEAMERLQTGKFSSAWLAMRSHASPAPYLVALGSRADFAVGSEAEDLSTERSVNEEEPLGQDEATGVKPEYKVQCQPTTAANAGLIAWQWVVIPDFDGYQQDSLLSPFDIEGGGYFWIDERMKSDLLGDSKSRKGRFIDWP